MSVVRRPAFRILLLVLLPFAVLTASAAAIAVHQRIAFVQWLLAEALAARGLGSTRFVVEEVGINRLVLSGVRSEFAGDLRAGRIAVHYAPREILDRHIRRLEIKDFAVSVGTADDGGPPSFDLAAWPAGASADSAPGWTVGTIDLRDARLTARGRWTAELAADGTARHLGGRSYEGALRLQGFVAPPGLRATHLDGSIAFAGSPDGITVLTAAVAADPLHLPLITAREGRLDAELRAGRLILRGDVLAEEGRIALFAEGPLPTAPSPTALRGRATVDLDLAGVGIPGTAVPVTIKGLAEIVSDDAELSVRALRPVVVTLTDDKRTVTVTVSPSAAPFVVAGPLHGVPHVAAVRIGEARIDAAGHPIAITDVDATVSLDPTWRAEVRRAQIADLGPPPAPSRVILAGRAALEGRRLLFNGTARGAADRLVVDFDGDHHSGSGTGRTRLRVRPLVFRPGQLQPTDLVRGLADRVSAVSGRIEAGGAVAWGLRAPPSDFTVHARELSFDVGEVRIVGLDGNLVFDRLWPPRTPPDQILLVRRIDVGAPMTGALVRFRVDDQTRLAIEEARVDLLGGRCSIGPAILDPASDRQQATVRLTGLDMEALLAISAIDGAAASGRLSGQVPLVVARDGFSVAGAVLETDAPGLLRYAPTVPPPALQGGAEGISLMLEALKNFHYDVIRVSIDGRSGDEWDVKLHVTGKNPDFMDGHPFVFNLNLSGKLDEIIRSGLKSYDLPARLGEEFSKERSRVGK